MPSIFVFTINIFTINISVIMFITFKLSNSVVYQSLANHLGVLKLQQLNYIEVSNLPALSRRRWL